MIVPRRLLLGMCALLLSAPLWGQALPTPVLPPSPFLPPVQAALEARQAAAQVQGIGPLSVSLAGLPVLREGMRDPGVLLLRQALYERGFAAQVLPPVGFGISPPSPPLLDSAVGYDIPPLGSVAWDPALYDEALKQAVYDAQRHYALAEDGVAGPRLYQGLAETGQALADALLSWADEIDAMASQARAQGHAKLIVVNIPSYTLKAIDLESGQTRMESRVIVGKPSRRTPVFSTNIVNLKYNPDWTPPPSLAAQGKRYVPAGPNNPLGRIRFSTDNNLNIYLHHTNEPDLFDRPVRALSSGCVRVEAWEDLADFLAEEDKDHVRARVASGKTVFEKIDVAPVFITYSLADVVSGRPALYPDVYGRNP